MSPTPTLEPTETATPTPAESPSQSPEPSATARPTQLPSTPTPLPTATPAPPVATPTSTPIATSTPLSGSELLAATLDSIGSRISLIRGLSSTEPLARELIDRDRAGEFLRGFYEDDREEIYETQRLYAALGILEKGEDLYEILLGLFSEGILGFFHRERETLYVVNEGGGFGPAEERTYSHEVIHGLQQQHFDSRALIEDIKSDSDRARAFSALEEGDARLAEERYVFQHMDAAARIASLGTPNQALIQAFRAAPHVVQSTYAFPYREGVRFVAGLFSDGGWPSVNAAFADPPRSTEQVLHPEKYVEGEEPALVEIIGLREALGEEWTLVVEDTFGEFLLRSYLETGFSRQKASLAAAGWGGDTYRLFEGPDDAFLLVWPILWDTEEDATEFFDIFLQFIATTYDETWQVDHTQPEIARMDLPGRHIFLRFEESQTLLIFAPDAATVDMAWTSLSAGSAE